MLETVILFGVIIFAGLALLFAAFPRAMRVWLMRHHVFTTLVVTGATLAIHWGTMTGLMSAAVAGLMCSLACFTGRWWWRIA